MMNRIEQIAPAAPGWRELWVYLQKDDSFWVEEVPIAAFAVVLDADSEERVIEPITVDDPYGAACLNISSISRGMTANADLIGILGPGQDRADWCDGPNCALTRSLDLLRKRGFPKLVGQIS